MPAAQIDVTIKDNNARDRRTSAASGYLFPSYKTEVYSRDGLGSDRRQPRDRSGAQLLRAVLLQYIPATARPTDAAGSPYGARRPAASTARAIRTGSAASSSNGLYRNWEYRLDARAYHPRADSKCLFSQTYPGDVHQYSGRFRTATAPSRSTPTRAARPTSNFVPGLGCTSTTSGSQQEPQRRLRPRERRSRSARPASTSSARYPYQPVTAADPSAADPVDFTVHNLFKKTLTVLLEGRRQEQHRLELGRQDRPRARAGHRRLAAARTSWSAGWPTERRGLRLFAGDLPAADGGTTRTRSSPRSVPRSVHDVPGSVGLNRLVHVHGSTWGNTAIEVFNSNKTKVDVIAEFVNEGILRDTSRTSGPRRSARPPAPRAPTAR